MPAIYAADVQIGKPKKLVTPETTTTSTAETAEKPKRTLSEETKQKLKEARERKKQERIDAQRKEEEEQRAQEEAARQAEAAAQAKREAAALKRKETRLKRKAETQGDVSEPAPIPQDTVATTEEKPAPKKPRRSRKSGAPLSPPPSDGDETVLSPKGKDQPPAWFTKFVTTIMTEKQANQGVKTSKKELKAEGEKTAEAKWADSYTRDRIRHAVDGHLGQMYSMIFS